MPVTVHISKTIGEPAPQMGKLDLKEVEALAADIEKEKEESARSEKPAPGPGDIHNFVTDFATDYGYNKIPEKKEDPRFSSEKTRIKGFLEEPHQIRAREDSLAHRNKVLALVIDIGIRILLLNAAGILAAKIIGIQTHWISYTAVMLIPHLALIRSLTDRYKDFK